MDPDRWTSEALTETGPSVWRGIVYEVDVYQQTSSFHFSLDFSGVSSSLDSK